MTIEVVEAAAVAEVVGVWVSEPVWAAAEVLLERCARRSSVA